MPDRTDIKQDELHNVIIRLFREALDLSESRCYEVTEPDQLPKVPSGSEYVLTLCFGDGDFPIEQQHSEQCCESLDLTVTAFSRVNLDSSNTDRMLLHDDRRGLLILKHKILKAVFDDPDPARESGQGFLRSYLSVRRSIRPGVASVGDKGVITVGRVAVVFDVTWDWDLS